MKKHKYVLIWKYLKIYAFIKKTRSTRNNFLGLALKLLLIVLVVFECFFLNKIDFPSPAKKIEKTISNENFKIVK